MILYYHNHEALVNEDDFMCAFNALSDVDFQGDPNPNYMPQRPFVRHDKAKRGCQPPVYAGLIFSDDVSGVPHRRMYSSYNNINDNYGYELSNLRSQMVFRVKADWLDGAIDRLLLERLEATTLDESAWQTALASTRRDGYGEMRRMESEIRSAERAKIAIMENLKTLQNPEMVPKNHSFINDLKESESYRIKSNEMLQPMLVQPSIQTNQPVIMNNVIHDHVEVEESLNIMDKEKELIIKALKKHRSKRKDAALDLGISERTLYRKLKEYDIEE